MLTLLFSISIAGLARHEKRRAWLWGPCCYLASALIQIFLIQGYWGAVQGFGVMFAAMTWTNMHYPVNKGPTLG